MIKTKSEYQAYLEADRAALKRPKATLKQKIIELFFPNYLWKFQRLLRKVEYLGNSTSFWNKNFLFPLYTYSFRKLSVKLGFTIPRNIFGPGLVIVHYGPIIVNGNAKVGKNCRLHPCTVIGASGGKPGAPTIGDNVYIGPGAKIYGKINIASGIVIGANATVNKSFIEENILIAGNPAVKVKSIDSGQLIKHLSKI